MNSAYTAYVQDPTFDTIIQELRRFEFISYITVHASLNNIAYRGDASTKQFIKEFKDAFSQDLNQMTDFLKDYLTGRIDLIDPHHAEQNPREEVQADHASAPLPDISEMSRTIMALSFPFFLKAYRSN